MNLADFSTIFPDLPHEVALYYTDVKRRFALTHERAYAETLKFAKRVGRAVGDEPGKPAHECRRFRLLLRREL